MHYTLNEHFSVLFNSSQKRWQVDTLSTAQSFNRSRPIPSNFFLRK